MNEVLSLRPHALQADAQAASNLPEAMPHDEASRLLALASHELVDTPPEASFDALVRSAARAMNTSSSMLSLIDADRVWFKASHGLAPGCTQRPRLGSPCAYAILGDEAAPLVVPDLAKDERFQGAPIPALQGPLRFYAGCPVFDEQGHALAVLAVADPLPRAAEAVDLAPLRDLTHLAWSLMSNRLRGRHLQRMAITDPLTGIGNPTQFHMTLDAELAHAMRTGEPFTVLCMELEGVKDVQQGFGRPACEQVLREVSRRLVQQLRMGDTPARLGDDCFGVVMRHGAKDAAQVLAKRIVKAVSAPIRLDSGDEIGVGIAVGMAAYSEAVGSVATLLAQADQALYQAKRLNERRWKMFVGIR